MAGGEFTAEFAVEVGARFVQAGDLHALAALGALGLGRVEGCDGEGVPDVGGGQVDDDPVEAGGVVGTAVRGSSRTCDPGARPATTGGTKPGFRRTATVQR